MVKLIRTFLCGALLIGSVLAQGQPARAMDKQSEALYGVQGRLSAPQDPATPGTPIVFGTEHVLQDGLFTVRVTLHRASGSDYEISGVLALNDSSDIIRWSSRRIFLVLFEGDTEVAKVYLPSSETTRHELRFKKSFSEKKTFTRFELTIIGDIRLAT
ncbi:MAG: hypothetical protein HY795_11770 [Desulfovibrio sp.]|nr:hypothetical protein [Desulfovibrio sp.]MBI4958129.1 hypothetical protein [Desulfovibrio sp.]